MGFTEKVRYTHAPSSPVSKTAAAVIDSLALSCYAIGRANAIVTDRGTTALASSGSKSTTFAANAVAKIEKVDEPTTEPKISGACRRIRARY